MSDQVEGLPPRILWYFADPMCSWCWGFAPVIRQIKQTYADRFPIALMLGGLRPYTEQALDAAQRSDILHHWENVQQLTGQSFTFAGAMPEGFIYDTEPPSRAVVTIGHLKPAAIFDYLESIHYAFYVAQRDVTKTEVLAQLAQERAVDTDEFCAYFDSAAARGQVQRHFARTRDAGVRGFPTLLLQKGESFTLLTSGYRPYADLSVEIDNWLQN